MLPLQCVIINLNLVRNQVSWSQRNEVQSMMEWDEQKDVVILGSGLAGLSAAIEAKQAGASVIVFEKMKVTGGFSHIL